MVLDINVIDDIIEQIAESCLIVALNKNLLNRSKKNIDDTYGFCTYIHIGQDITSALDNPVLWFQQNLENSKNFLNNLHQCFNAFPQNKQIQSIQSHIMVLSHYYNRKILKPSKKP